MIVALAIACCLLIVRSAAIFGFSRLLVTYSLTTGNLAAANTAIQLSPQDPEAHLAAASVMSLAAPNESVIELERAVALRPDDYELWSELGLLRDQTGDSTAALAAFDEAIRRAPFYSQPRWNRGNVLLRNGQYEAAFNDLNQAAQSNPELIPNLIDLAWGISRNDLPITEQLAQINSNKKRVAFARLLARRGEAKDAVAEFVAARNVPAAIKHEVVDVLLAKGAFKEAFEIWKLDHGLAQVKNDGPSIYDGGFEGPLVFAEGGFGWRVPRDLPATSVLLDSGEPQSGAQDLRIEFGGNSNPGSMIVSQIILVEPARRYKINFASRSRDIVTGGLPLLAVTDAAGATNLLGKSALLAKGTSAWQSASFEFTTAPTTSAVSLGLVRESCSTTPCPIFGSISLDSFSIEKLK